MSNPLDELLTTIAAGDLPPVILIGGDNEFLTDHVFGRVRDALLERHPDLSVETFPPGADLGVALDSFRTFPLFGGKRLLVVTDVNAFVTQKELASLYEKAARDWSTAKSDRKRSSAVAKLMHVLGLIGLDVDAPDAEIAEALALKKTSRELVAMLELARATGRHASRGEADAAILAEAIVEGGAPSTVLLLRSGELPAESATLDTIGRAGSVMRCDLTREQFPRALQKAIEEIARDFDVRFEPQAIDRLREKLGIDRILGDRYSSEIPSLRLIVAEAERLATFVGRGGRVTAAVVSEQIASVEGGARFEFGSLYTEGKPLEALAKLRDLIAQARRDEPTTPLEIQYGRFLFPLADEIRQMIGIVSFCRIQGLDPRRAESYNRFKSSIADPLAGYLRDRDLVRQKPHPFPLHKRYVAAGRYGERRLVEALREIAEIEFRRKSGGSAELGLERLLLAEAGRR